VGGVAQQAPVGYRRVHVLRIRGLVASDTHLRVGLRLEDLTAGALRVGARGPFVAGQAPRSLPGVGVLGLLERCMAGASDAGLCLGLLRRRALLGRCGTQDKCQSEGCGDGKQ
jgi:hypothetical protein